MPTPPEWTIGWPDILGAVGALLLIGGAVIVVWRFVNPIAVKVARAVDLLLGRPAEQGIPAMPSMIERIDEVSKKVSALDEANAERLGKQNEEIAEIKAQVTPNHGTSAHDKITTRIEGVEAKVDAVLAHLGLSPTD